MAPFARQKSLPVSAADDADAADSVERVSLQIKRSVSKDQETDLLRIPPLSILRHLFLLTRRQTHADRPGMEALTQSATLRRRWGRDTRVSGMTARIQRVGILEPHRYWALAVLLTVWSSCFATSQTFAQDIHRIQSPAPSTSLPISFTAQEANQWKQGQYFVWHLRGEFKIQQGELVARGQEAILWISFGDPYIGEPKKIIAYVEGSVEVEFTPLTERIEDRRATSKQRTESWIERFETSAEIKVDVAQTYGRPPQMPTALTRGLAARNGPTTGRQPHPIQLAQHLTPLPSGAGPVPEALPNVPPTPSHETETTNVELFPTTSGKFDVNSRQSKGGREQITTAGRGVKVVITSTKFSSIPNAAGAVEQIVITADHVVAWSNPLDLRNPASIKGKNQHFEVYLEGNVVFDDGQRTIFADQMYYDVNAKRGTILNAEMLTPVPEYQGLLRLKAEILQQIDEDHFHGYKAAITSSRMGFPRYWVQPNEIDIEHRQVPLIDPYTGQPFIDHKTGEPVYDHQYLATSRNNVVYLAGVPVFYWPTLATDLTRPSYYVTGVKFGNDNVFGFRSMLDLDMYQLLGMKNAPKGTDWDISLDYLSKRGFGLGTKFKYEGDSFLKHPGPYKGFIDGWGIRDGGTDNLGADRRMLTPAKKTRGRVLYQHIHELYSGWRLKSELGYISDNNLLEQYFESEWDQNKDQVTGTVAEYLWDNRSFSITADSRLNNFFTQTEWLPKADAFVLGQSLFGDRAVLNSHSSVGYYKMKTAAAPSDPADLAKFKLLPYEADVEGLRFQTRNEISTPFSAGPFKFAPYLSGEVAHWGEDVNGQEATRLMGQTGVRASIPLVKVDPTVQSTLLNLDGLAHKVLFDLDFHYTDTNQDFSRFAGIDPLDDDAQEHFRRRFQFDDFGGTTPLRFDARNYSIRSGIQNHVTSPTTEMADDLMAAKMGIRQRWQTKRGLPGQQRIIDWISLDVEGTLFPKSGRDNFGQGLGMVDYDFRWHLGDRFSVLSDGYFDFFSNGLQTASIGGLLSRPEYGELYIGFRGIDGPIKSQILSSSLSYRMSEKWIGRAGSSYDFGPTGSIGQSFSFVRIGESFLAKFGFNVDVSKGNAGFVFSLEPRFLPKARLGQVGGVFLPAHGSKGLE